LERVIRQDTDEIQLGYRAPKILEWLFLLYIFVKPFYIFTSGSFQPGDVVFVLAFIVFIYFNMGTNLIFCKNDYVLLTFLFFVAIINFIYFTFYFDVEFVKSILYYVFNFLFIITARFLLNDREFIKKLFWVCRIVLYFQIVIYFLGVGRFYESDGMISTRYMGTFNDPNQLAFYEFSLLMILYIIDNMKLKGCKINVIDYAAFVFIVYLTSSTGMLLALAVFAGTYLAILLFSSVAEKDAQNRSRVMWTLFIIGVLLVVFFINKNFIISQMEKSELFSRLLEKETLTTSTTGSELAEASIWQDRNIDKLYIYPTYNIFGAGQGHFERFWKAHSSGEIHSTLLSILFCYGVIPTVLFLHWIWKNIQRSSKYFIPVFAAVFIEGLTLLNQRQPTFWLLFLLAYAYRAMEENKYENDIYSR